MALPFISIGKDVLSYKHGHRTNLKSKHHFKGLAERDSVMLSYHCIPQARRRHARLPAGVCVQSGVHRKWVHEVERSGEQTHARMTKAATTTEQGFIILAVSASFADDCCRHASANAGRDHQKGADHQRSHELQIQWQRHRGCQSLFFFFKGTHDHFLTSSD